jgi:hypothetical protein
MTKVELKPEFDIRQTVAGKNFGGQPSAEHRLPERQPAEKNSNF